MVINTFTKQISTKLNKINGFSSFLKIASSAIVVVWLIVLSVNFSGCSSDSPVSPTGTVSFSRDIQPIFESSCNFPGCHNSVDKQNGIDLTSWHSLMITGSHFGSEIVPYNSRWSHMMQHINRVDTNISPFAEPVMPKALVPYSNGQPLSASTVHLIQRWIEEGAKNDEGEVAFANINNKAFITNQASDLVAVVNLDNMHLVRLIPVGGRPQLDAPHVIIADNQGTYFYVSLISEGYIEKYNAHTYELVGRMFAGTSPAHIVISNDGSYGFYSNFDASASPEKCIKRFNTADMTITDTIIDAGRPAGMIQPHGLRFTHNNNYVLGATEKGELLYVINTATDEIEDAVPVDPTVPLTGNGTGNFVPYQVAITPDDRYVFVSCLKSNDVRVFDLQTRTFIQTIAVGLNPLALEISPDGRWCYVPNRNSNSVTVIDVQTRTVVKTIPSVGAQPHKLDFTADGRYCYVTCESTSGGFIHHPPVAGKAPGTTAVIDVLAGHVKIKDIEMASFPAGISITPGIGN